MSEAQFLESLALKNLQQSYEARGLKFYLHPQPGVIPPFLGNFQPDAMAVGPEGGIIIKVKRRNGPESAKHLVEIANRVADQKGWEFRAIYVNPPADETAAIAMPTHEQLDAAFREIDALTKDGHPAAALMVAWAALESLARLATRGDESRKPRTFSSVQPIQTLAEEGYIENEAADRLRGMAKLRDAVVHGDFSVDVEKQQVVHLLEQLQAISSSIASVMREQSV